MNYRRIKFIFVFFLLLFVLACNNSAQKTNSELPESSRHREPTSTHRLMSAYQMGGDVNNSDQEMAHAVIVDSHGNQILTGHFKGTMDFNLNSAITDVRSSNNNSLDVFITKINNAGITLWTHTFGGLTWDRGVSIDMDASGNIYVIGEGTGEVNFDPNGANNDPTQNFTINFGNKIGAFVLKLNLDGQPQWVRVLGIIDAQASSSVDDYVGFHTVGKFIDLAADGSIYITGTFVGPAILDPLGTPLNVLSSNNNDIFYAKVNANVGDIAWIAAVGGIGYDIAYAVNIDANGDVVFVGHIEDSVDLNPDPVAVDNHSSNGAPVDVFMSRFHPDGSYVGSATFGGTGEEWIYAAQFDNDSNLYVTGVFSGTADFDPSGDLASVTADGNYDLYLSKYDINFNHIWTRTIGSIDIEYHSMWGVNMSISAKNNVYLSRCFKGSVVFDPEFPDDSTLTTSDASNNDIFLTKFLSSGDYEWTQSFGGSGTECANAMVVTASESIYMVGEFDSSDMVLATDPETTMTPLGASDIFVLRLDEVQ